MNQLLEKFNEYKSIVNYRVVYEFEDGNIIEFVPKQTDFPHLIGLHKLVDIPIIRQFNDKSNQSDLYLRNQKQIKIKSIKIFDDKGNLFLEDTLL